MSDDWGNKFFDDLKSREDAKHPVERLVMQADEYGDNEEMVYSGELFLLKKVYEMANDFIEAKTWEEFAEKYPDTENSLNYAVHALNQWYSDGDCAVR